MASREHLTRVFVAQRFQFRVACGTAESRDIIDRLFHDLTDFGAVSGDSTTLNQAGLAYNDFGLSTDAFNGDRALDGLVGRINAYAMRSDNEHLHLHAAGLQVDGVGLIVPAHSGTGKTTLAAIFASRGHGYLSDEAVSIDFDGARVTGFPKPLSVKQSGHEMMDSFGQHRVTFGVDSGSSWQIPASILGATPLCEIRPSFIALLERNEDLPEVSRPTAFIHPVEAAVRLLDHVLDAKRFCGSTLRVASRLAMQCSAVRVRAGSTAEEAADTLTQVMKNSPQPPKIDFEALVPCSGNAPVDGQRIPISVQSVRLGDRVVLFNTESRRSAALDEAGANLWVNLIDGEAPPRSDRPGVRTFLDQLHLEGFLDGPPADRHR